MERSRLKRALSSLLLFLLIFNITACSNLPASSPATAMTPQDSDIYTSTYQKNATADPEVQNTLIMEKQDVWSQDFYTTPWYYTLTDLDHNGLKEVITAQKAQGEESAAFNCREVTDDLQDLMLCKSHIESATPCPDFVVDSLPCFYDEDADLYYYIFENVDVETETKTSHIKSAIYLEDKEINYLTVATCTETVIGPGDTKIVYKDHDGNLIDETSYNTAEDLYFKDFEKMKLVLDWFESSETGSIAPDDESTADEDAALAEDAEIVITKNPSGECINVGGGTYFIAHADNAQSISWYFEDPNQRQHSLEETMELNPELALEAMSGDTLAVSNVPLSLNNWSVVASFHSAVGKMDTVPAKIVVADYLKLYADVISSYTDYMHSRGEDPDIRTVYTQEPDHLTIGDSSLGSISPYADQFLYVGYYFKDINKDSIPELIISGTNESEDDPTGIILDLFTLVNGNVTRIAASSESSRYSFRSDSEIYYHSEQDEFNSLDLLLQFNGHDLKPVDAISSAANSANNGSVTIQGSIAEDGTISFENRITAVAYGEKLDEFTGSLVSIPFTKFI